LTMGERMFVQSFNVTPAESLEISFAAGQWFPYDHRFRDHAWRLAVMRDQRGLIPPPALSAILARSATRDPWNIELWWNLFVINNRAGRTQVLQEIIDTALRIAPVNLTIRSAAENLKLSQPH
jgi:hypothetical protein